MSTLPIDDALLVAYVDGELDDVIRQRVADLIEKNASVRDRAAMFRRSTDLLRSALSGNEFMDVPEQLVSRTTKIVKHNPRPRLAWLSLPVAAAIVGLVVGNLALPPNLGVGQSSSGRLASILEDVRDYYVVHARETEHVVEVPASRRDHIEAWLGDRVHYPFTVPDLSSRGLTFLGARLVAISDGVVAQLMYVDGGGEQLAICIGFTEGKLDAPLQSIQQGRIQVIGRAEGHHAFVVVGLKSDPAVESIARSLPGLLQGTKNPATNYGGFARPG